MSDLARLIKSNWMNFTLYMMALAVVVTTGFVSWQLVAMILGDTL